MLPLTPGCKALIIKGNSTGKEVICIKHLGRHPIFNNPDCRSAKPCWEINCLVLWRSPTGEIAPVKLRAIPTEYLMRIDGHEEQPPKERTHKIPEPTT